MDKDLIEELRHSAGLNWNKGGDYVYECWEDKDYQQLIDDCKATGKDPKVELRKHWELMEEIAEDIRKS